MIRNLFCLLFLSHSMSIMAKDYVVTDFGAKSDTTVVSTDAVQQCIDLCSADGGGRVVVPAGQYVIGTIILRSNVHLHLELGATLYGSTDLKDYRRVKSSYKSLRGICGKLGIKVSKNEFHCPGEFNGLHKGKPDEADARVAAAFAVEVVNTWKG